MIVIFTGTVFAALVLLLVFGLSGATYVLAGALSFLTQNQWILFIIVGVFAVLAAFVNAGDGKFSIIGIAGDFFIGCAFLVVALTEMQTIINSANNNLVLTAILIILGIAEVLMLLTLVGGGGYLISMAFATHGILKMLLGYLFFVFCGFFIASQYPHAYADLFANTPIDFLISSIPTMVSQAIQGA